jgi:hypothetical protein
VAYGSPFGGRLCRHMQVHVSGIISRPAHADVCVSHPFPHHISQNQNSEDKAASGGLQSDSDPEWSVVNAVSQSKSALLLGAL